MRCWSMRVRFLIVGDLCEIDISSSLSIVTLVDLYVVLTSTQGSSVDM